MAPVHWPAYQMISSMHIVLMIILGIPISGHFAETSVGHLEIDTYFKEKKWMGDVYKLSFKRNLRQTSGHSDVDVILNSILKNIWMSVSQYHTFMINWMLQVSETQLANRWGGFYDEMWLSKDVLSVDDCETDETPISYSRYERRGTRQHTYTFWTYILCFY